RCRRRDGLPGLVARTSSPRRNALGTNLASVHGEAVEEPGAAGGFQVALAAAPAEMRRVPRGVAPADAVVVAHHRAPGAVARPVVAGRRGRVSLERSRVGDRARQDVVLVGLIAPAPHHLAPLVEGGLLGDVVAIPLDVAVEV